MITTDDFEIEDLGIQENWVYDIEVEDNHNFFANNILVHNSFYFTIAPFMEKYCKETDVIKQTEWANNLYKKIIDPIIKESSDEFSKRLNLYNKDYIGVEREVISDKGFFIAKKKYVLRVLDLEGTIYTKEDPYIKKQGVEIIQGGTAPFSKKYLEESIPILLDLDEKEVQNWIQSKREEFINANLIDIAKTVGISKIEDENWGKIKNGRIQSPPSNSKAGIATNNYIKKHNQQDLYPLIDAGNKAKMLYLKPNNPFNNDRFAFLNENFAKNFKKYIDYDTNWEKYFLKPLKNMTDALGYNIDKKAEKLDIW